ncbi:MAG: helix-turn-helix transcriptional regulator [Mycobacterium sp.]
MAQLPDYQWRLRELMAERGMFSTTDLRPLLQERGVNLSPSQVYRLVVERPERLSLKVLMALIDLLGCRMEELIQPVAANAVKRAAGNDKPSGRQSAPERLGTLRPRRARVIKEYDGPAPKA